MFTSIFNRVYRYIYGDAGATAFSNAFNIVVEETVVDSWTCGHIAEPLEHAKHMTSQNSLELAIPDEGQHDLRPIYEDPHVEQLEAPGDTLCIRCNIA